MSDEKKISVSVDLTGEALILAFVLLVVGSCVSTGILEVAAAIDGLAEAVRSAPADTIPAGP